MVTRVLKIRHAPERERGKLNVFTRLRKYKETPRDFVFLFENESVADVLRAFKDAVAAGQIIIMQ
jgi:hypothetical protein